MTSSSRFLVLTTLLAIRCLVVGHPIPDIPVRGYFESDGSATIRVEVDTRCFVADPEKEPYLQHWVWKEMKEKERSELLEKARGYLGQHLRFYFQPLPINPEFKFSFTTFDNKPLEKIDAPVMITGEWRTKVPKGIEGYQLESLKSGRIDIQFQNFIDGREVEKSFCVLFPGEKSVLLDLSGLVAARPESQPGSQEGAVSVHDTSSGAGNTFWQFLRKGFRHVIPEGLDHVLFVLGLFFLSREWRPLLYQVTMFTLAHTITLALATIGVLRVSAAVVEPVIAASIAYVAVENIWRARYTHWRLAVVFGFGLIHGLGFAGVLGEYGLGPGSLVVGLIGFNVGVEFGQLTVITLAFGATAWLRKAEDYRRYIVVPASVAIAVVGVYWTVERVAGNLQASPAPSEMEAPVAASVGSTSTGSPE